MTTETRILERLEQMDAKIEPLANSARSLAELREEIAPRVNEAVQALIKELADIEGDFQVEDLLFFMKKALRNVRNLNFAMDQLKNLVDFALTAEPLLKATVPQVISYLDILEQKGVFTIMHTALATLKKIGETYTEEDMQQVGDGFVRLIGVAKTLTAPESLDLLEKAAEIPAKIDCSAAKPVGLFGLMGALGNPDVKEGMGVLLEMSKGLSALKG